MASVGRRAAVCFLSFPGLVRVCEIELSHMGKTTEIPIWYVRIHDAYM